MTNSWQKGKGGESEVVLILKKAGIENAKRAGHLQRNPVGVKPPDIINTPWWVEVKREAKKASDNRLGKDYDKAYGEMQDSRDAGVTEDMDVMVWFREDCSASGKPKKTWTIILEKTLAEEMNCWFESPLKAVTRHGVNLVKTTHHDFIGCL